MVHKDTPNFDFGDFYFNKERTTLSRNGKVVLSEGKPFQLLLTLFKNRGSVVTHNSIVKALYGVTIRPEKCIDAPEIHKSQVHKQALCKKIGNHWIEPDHGRGYSFLSNEQLSSRDVQRVPVISEGSILKRAASGSQPIPAGDTRRLFVASNRREFAEILHNRGKQTAHATRGLKASTLLKIARGGTVIERTARAALQKLAPSEPFETLFKLAPGKEATKKFTWEHISRSAAQVGREIFKEFKPDLVITFAGPPALFTSLAMLKALTRDDLLRTSFYTALYRSKGSSLPPPGLEGYETIESLRFVLHVPRLVGEIPSRSEKRVCVIECTVTTGSVLETLKKHLVAKGYQGENIRYACCVCASDTYAQPHTRPNYWTYKIQGKYRLPWGKPL